MILVLGSSAGVLPIIVSALASQTSLLVLLLPSCAFLGFSKIHSGVVACLS